MISSGLKCALRNRGFGCESVISSQFLVQTFVLLTWCNSQTFLCATRLTCFSSVCLHPPRISRPRSIPIFSRYGTTTRLKAP